ncbi:MAG: hypothetical protein OXH00_06725 [Candidatus Poribacteria bacterium]|nr:hypothetical protein [Candidatus Poribacteria bacterium]
MRLFEKCVALFVVLLIFFVVGCGDKNEESEQPLDPSVDPTISETGGSAINPGEWDTLSQSQKTVKY